MDLKLLQSEIAKLFGVSTDCITNWEYNRTTPQINYFPRIIQFLGYLPLEFDETNLSGRLKAYRFENGLSNRDLGKLIGVDGSTVLDWENGKSVPQTKQIAKLKTFFKQGTNK